MIFPGGGMDMVQPRGESNPERDIHSAAFFSKVSAMANIAQIFQNQRTNQLLEAQLKLQGMSEINAQLKELEEEITSNLQNQIEAHNYLVNEGNSGLVNTIKPVSADFDELHKRALRMGEYLNFLRNSLHDIETPEEFESFVMEMESNATCISEYWDLYQFLGLRITLCNKIQFADEDSVPKSAHIDLVQKKFSELAAANIPLWDHFELEFAEFDKCVDKITELKSEMESLVPVIERDWYNLNESFFTKAFGVLDEYEKVWPQATSIMDDVLSRAIKLTDNAFTSVNERQPSLEMRLIELSKLLEKGLISKSEYAKQRKKLLDSF